ncbi:MAG: sigma-70 family RNA polymerase sigma factor [Byssovorax sp.]
MSAKRDPQPSDMSPLLAETPAERPTFDAIFADAERYVYRSLRQFRVPERDCPDVAQEVLLIVHRRLDTYDPSLPLKPWLKGIAWYKSKDYHELSRNRHERVTADGQIDLEEVAPSSEERLIRKQRYQLFFELLDALDPEQKIVLIMHEIEGHSLRETAAALEIPEGTAATRLRLGREGLEALRKRRALQDRSNPSRGTMLFPIPASLEELLRSGHDSSEPPAGPPSSRLDAPRGAGQLMGKAGGQGVARAGLGWGLPRLAGWGLGVFLAGGAAGSLVTTLVRPGPAIVASAPPPVESAPLSQAVDQPTSAPSPAPPDMELVASKGAEAAPSTAPLAKTASPTPTLDPSEELERRSREAKLIQGAKVAIDHGNFSDAAEALDLHARLYPRGRLAAAREELRAQLRAQRGSHPESGEHTDHGPVGR